MKSKAKLLGHPIHPMLIVFPLGLFIAAIVFDILYLVTDNPTWSIVAFWNIAGGVIGGLGAAVFGFWDWLAIPNGTRAKTIGAIHGFTNVVVVVLFIMSWLLRWPNSTYSATTLAFILELLAFGIAGFAGWLGGELVDRLGVGVDPRGSFKRPQLAFK